MTAEPTRRRAYADDLRWRVVWQRLGMEESYTKIAKNLNISLSTAHRIYKQFESTGSVKARVSVGRKEDRLLSESEEALLLGIVMENPSLYLREMQSQIKDLLEISVSQATICRILHRHSFTRKKAQVIAKQRSDLYRTNYKQRIMQFGVEKLVFADETGCDRRDFFRNTGYSLRGCTPQLQSIVSRGKRYNAMAAISIQGMLGVDIVSTGSGVNGDAFMSFLYGSVIPNMHPFDGSPEPSILVMDNCSIHHVTAVQSALDNSGILTQYLPPYSPDYNPIEHSFSYVKQYLKNHADVLDCAPDSLPIIHAAFQSITPAMCKGWISHAGYSV